MRIAMGTYDRNVIILITSGEIDSSLEEQAAALQSKAETKGVVSSRVTVRFDASARTFRRDDADSLGRAIADVSGDSRIYLAGPGDWEAGTIGGAAPDEVAALLAGASLHDVRLISIVSSELGRDSGTSQAERISSAMDSFAARLHRLLKQSGIATTLHARVYRTRTSVDADSAGRKITADADDQFDDSAEGHHRPNSKLRFYWDGDVQKRDWAY
jgi:hypothetical protein